jgi:hypothetical protein
MCGRFITTHRDVSRRVEIQVTVCRQKMTSKAFVPSNHKDLDYGELASAYLESVRLTAGFTSCFVDTVIIIVTRAHFNVIRW